MHLGRYSEQALLRIWPWGDGLRIILNWRRIGVAINLNGPFLFFFLWAWWGITFQMVEQQKCLFETQAKIKNKKSDIKHGTVTRVVALLLLLGGRTPSCLMQYPSLSCIAATARS